MWRHISIDPLRIRPDLRSTNKNLLNISWKNSFPSATEVTWVNYNWGEVKYNFFYANGTTYITFHQLIFFYCSINKFLQFLYCYCKWTWQTLFSICTKFRNISLHFTYITLVSIPFVLNGVKRFDEITFLRIL